MARRRTHTDAVRSRIVSIRLVEADYLKLKLDAAWAGLTVSGLAEQYVRHGKIEVKQSDRPVPLSPVLMAELKRIGNNLNQIAHAVNSSLPPETLYTASTLHQLIGQLAQDEILAQRIKAAAKKVNSHDPAPPQARSEFQRSVQLHPARPGE